MNSDELTLPNCGICNARDVVEGFPVEESSSSGAANNSDDWELIPNPVENSSSAFQDPFHHDCDLFDPSALVRAQDVFITLDSRSPFYDVHRAALCQSPPFHEPYKYDRLVKLHFIGDSDVGKTAMIHRLITEEYLEDRTPHTYWMDFSILERVYWNSAYRGTDLRPQQLRIHVFDVAGFHRNPMSSSYFRGCHGIFLCFSVSDRESFKSLESHWLPLIREHLGENVAMIMVGTKCDVSDSSGHSLQRQVSTSEAQRFARQIRVPYLECSARHGIRVNDCLATLLHHVAMRLSNANDHHRLQKAGTESRPPLCSIM